MTFENLTKEQQSVIRLYISFRENAEQNLIRANTKELKLHWLSEYGKACQIVVDKLKEFGVVV